MKTNSEIIKDTKSLVKSWETGEITGNKGYKFRTKEFLDIAYLYWSGVDVGNPDLIGANNPNTFILDQRSDIEKILEQTRIDLKEGTFVVDNSIDLSEYVVKAANRKFLQKNNDFTETEERVTDDANIYGSGFKKKWSDSKGIRRFKALDPWDIIRDVNNFKGMPKAEKVRTTVNKILANDKYSDEVKELLANAVTDEKERQKEYVIYQVLEPQADDTENLYLVDIDNELVIYTKEDMKGLQYIKRDRVKRRGFPDAQGVGIIEVIFNIIVQDKVGRERLDGVLSIMSNLVFQKVADGENDKIAGRQVHKLKNGLVLATKKEGEIKPLEMGGSNQIITLQNHINEMAEKSSKVLSTPDVLQGDAKTLGANASGVAINSLAEFASSIHKDVKKRFARQVEEEYRDGDLEYILSVFDSNVNILKYLEPSDVKVVKRNIVDYRVAIAQIDAEINGEEFDEATERKMAIRDVKKSNAIPGVLLDRLKEDVQGIEVVFSGEKASRTVRDEFITEIKADFLANPEIIQNPTYIRLVKEKAKINSIDGLIVEELFSSLSEQ